jgi:hypothetical protein
MKKRFKFTLFVLAAGLIIVEELGCTVKIFTYSNGKKLTVSYENNDNSLIFVGDDGEFVNLNEKDLKAKAGISAKEIVEQIKDGKIAYSDVVSDSFWKNKMTSESHSEDGELFDVKKRKKTKKAVESRFIRERYDTVDSKYFVREASDTDKNSFQLYVVKSMPSLRQTSLTCYFYSIFNMYVSFYDKKFKCIDDTRKSFEIFYKNSVEKIGVDDDLESSVANKLIYADNCWNMSKYPNVLHINCNSLNEFIDYGLREMTSRLICMYIENKILHIVLNSKFFVSKEIINRTRFSWKPKAYGEVAHAHALFVKVTPATQTSPLTLEVYDSFNGADNRYARLIHALASTFIPALGK